ncbi:MAG: exopolysaccharide biosynthesis protein [Rickettsiales bacterium]|jgi:hypothetical protein|nr:exopolysaccharide biosynthesis protein [Rickettsiales bacterium]
MDNKKITDLLNDVKGVSGADKVPFKTLVNNGSNSFYFFILIITILSFLPLIFAIVCGVINTIITAQLVVGEKTVKLPEKIGNILIKRSILITTIDKINPYLKKLESCTKNRFLFCFNDKFMYFLHIYLLLLSIIITVPIPLSGTIPAIAILLIIFGILNKDGAFVLSGLLVGLISLLVVTCLALLGTTIFLKFLMNTT